MTTIKEDEDFSIQGYLGLIERFRSYGYTVTSFCEAVAGEQHLVIRHDVDFSLDLALELAKTEASAGICSTYFVLVRTGFYNVLSKPAGAAIKRIVDLGHDVGLHLDPSLYPKDANALKEGACEECRVLEKITKAPIKLISFHRPTLAKVDFTIRFPGRTHTYEPKFVEHMGYCSDSRGRWRFRYPLDHRSVKERRALQLLTHPIWWVVPGQSPREKLERMLERFDEFQRLEIKNQTTGIL